jgi:hypothetical protein
MSRMINFGNGLQKAYNGSAKTDLLTDSDKKNQKADHNALRNASKAKRKAREERQELRMARNISPDVEMKILEQNPEKDIDVKSIQKQAKSETNALAREYGLTQPNNPEALAHDRLHCMMCDRKLDSPHTGNFGANSLFNEEDVRLMCCWCFGNMSDSEIRTTAKSGKEADSEIRLKVYNPEESTKAEVESLIESKMIQMKGKLRRWKQDVELVGKVKHNTLEDVDYLEFGVRNRANTRYTACTW